MKKILCSILLCICVSAQSPPTPAQGAPEDASSKKARALVQRGIEALGGQAFLSYTDMESEGRTYGFYKGEPRGTGAPFWRFWKWPDKERLELLKTREWVIVYNGDKAVETTYHGNAPVEPEQLSDYLRRREYSVEAVFRNWIGEAGVAFFYDGAAIANQKPAERVTIMNTRNQSVSLFFDKNSQLLVMKSFTWRDPRDRERNEETETYDNYRAVQGVMTPFSVTRTRNGMNTSQRFITSVKYNQGVADSMFVLPALTPPKPAR